jgi:hypothetical protein
MSRLCGHYHLVMNSTVRALAISAILLGNFLGCQNDPTVWIKDFRSPDQAWVATARTRQWGGFGTGWIETTVDVLSYPDGGSGGPAYVLSDANADRDLKVNWLSPTHLEIAHTSPINPDLEVVRFSNIDISYRLPADKAP